MDPRWDGEFSMKTLILNSAEVQMCLPLDDLREAMENSLEALSSKEVQNYPRFVVPFRKACGLGFMPATNNEVGLLGYKAVSVFPGNPEKLLNPHQGIVVLLD